MHIRKFDRQGFLASLNNSPTPDSIAALNPFATTEWLRCYAEVVATDDNTILAVSNNESDAGVINAISSLLLLISNDDDRVVKSFNNYYASDFLIPAHVDASTLGHSLSRLPKRPSRIAISPTTSQEKLTALAAGFSGTRWGSNIFKATGNWYLPCENLTFDAYLEWIKQRGDNPVRRKTKAFLKDKENRLEVISDAQSAIKAAALFERVYAKSWRTGESHPEFVGRWIAICAERGWLRLGVAWHKDIPIAAQFWFCIDRKSFIYKMAYDEAYAALSAGTALSGEMFRYALDVDKVSEVDYLSGDDRYKQTWVTHRRQLWGIECFNLRTLAGLGGYARTRLVASRFVKYARAIHEKKIKAVDQSTSNQ
jgi:Acetyltransferase (GNAT) domain